MLHYHKGPYLAQVPKAMERAVMSAMCKLPGPMQVDLLGFLEEHLALGLTQTEGG